MHRFPRQTLVSCILCSALAACSGATSDQRDDNDTTDSGKQQVTDAGNHPDAGSQGDAGTTPDAGPGNDAGMDDDAGSGTCTLPATTTHQSYNPFTSKPANAVRLIVLGDSISAGYGATDSAGNECSDQCPTSYVGLLQTNDNTVWPAEANTSLSALYNTPNFPIVTVAHPGDTTTNLATDQLTNLTTQIGASVSGHSIVVITIGGNDMVGELTNTLGNPTQAQVNTTINTIISNIRTAITYLQDPTRFPDGTSIYLAALYDPSDGTGTMPYSCFGFGAGELTSAALETGVNDLFTRYQQLAQDASLKPFAVIDDLNHFHGHGLTATCATSTSASCTVADPDYDKCDPVDWFFTDCIHPTNDGHNQLRRLFFEAIDVGGYTATEL